MFIRDVTWFMKKGSVENKTNYNSIEGFLSNKLKSYDDDDEKKWMERLKNEEKIHNRRLLWTAIELQFNTISTLKWKIN